MKNFAMLNGTLKEIAKESSWENQQGDIVKYVLLNIQTPTANIPVIAYGDYNIEYAKSKVGQEVDLLCSVAGNMTTVKNADDEEVSHCYPRLQLKKFL